MFQITHTAIKYNVDKRVGLVAPPRDNTRKKLRHCVLSSRLRGSDKELIRDVKKEYANGGNESYVYIKGGIDTVAPVDVRVKGGGGG